MNSSLDVMQGTLSVLILKALSVEPMHGWGISSRLQTMSQDVFRIGQGSLYPALHRFETLGWVMSHWQPTDNNRVARYYTLTAAGHRALRDEIDRWRLYASTVDRVIEAT